jgi:hypothetical protein
MVNRDFTRGQVMKFREPNVAVADLVPVGWYKTP